MANLLKGAATRAAIAAGVHPLAAHAKPGERPPPMWAAHQWKTYLDTERSVEEAIAYVRDNPIKEGKAEQNWSFITPFAGIPTGGWTTYH
ncbi:MAG: hypothetical protein R3C53_00320 [Pirellulaceae bacterium]